MNGKDLKQSGKRKMGRKQIQVQISRTEVWPEIKKSYLCSGSNLQGYVVFSSRAQIPGLRSG